MLRSPRRLARALLSDRGRPWKAAAALLLLTALCAGFVAGPGKGESAYVGLAHGRLPRPGPAELVGPENLLVEEVRPGGLLARKFETQLELVFPAGPEGERARAAAAEVRVRDYVIATTRHLEGSRFELVELVPNPRRKLKLLVSGAAALFVAALVPLHYRWSRGALRPRAGGEGG